MPEKEEPFANPAAPPGAPPSSSQHANVESTPARLTNADFRKLLMTPRAGGPAATPASTTSTSSTSRPEISGKVDKAEERRKKKSYYAKLKRAEDDIMAELAKKYRDRAKERRDGDEEGAAGVPEFPNQQEDAMTTAGAYRAVAPDLKSGIDAAERRRQQIQESKFLGGDMEHTHLVKGLDYALLQKVRSEIQAMELEHEDELEKLADGVDVKKREENREEEVQFKTKLGKNIYRALFKDRPPQRNDLFLPGRTAYRIDLDEEYVDFDIPTTVVRSKADCPQVETATTLTTNDIVINKLTQILSYLRQGRSGRRLKKRDRQQLRGEKERRAAAEDIYGETGEYQPGPARRERAAGEKTGRQEPGDRDRERGERRPRGSYFDEPGDDKKDRDKQRDRVREKEKEKQREREEQQEQEEREKERAERDKHDKEKFEREKGRESNWLNVDAAAKQRSKDLGTALSGYAECYPGQDEMVDAIDDSDDEADYSKMDMGNKKGPIGRWDFDTQEEYGNYMNQKEALPKAAFQYGVKMADGRKTRRLPKEKNEKAELDREWQKISAIIAKRKGAGEDGGDKKRTKTPQVK